MGVFLSVNVSGSVTPEQWQSVYEKSLKMAEAFKLCHSEKVTIHGNEMDCLVQSHECCRGESEEDKCWYACGDLETYKFGENQYFPKYIKNTENEAFDAIISLIPDKAEIIEHKFSTIFGRKTQGEPYHMKLLAIGSMIEHELGMQAVLSGDITFGQCIEAAKLASETLDEDIQPSVRCRYHDLLDRINAIHFLRDHEKLELLLNIYLGSKNAELGSFLQEKFSKELLDSYWSDKISTYKIEQRGFTDIFKEYFELGFDLEFFCRKAPFDHNDTEQVTKFIDLLLDGKLHIKDKDCENIFDLSSWDEPYGIHSMIISFMFGDLGNPAVDRYIPLDEIKAVLKKVFPAADIENIILEHEKNAPPDDDYTIAASAFKEKVKKISQEISHYDICQYSDIVYFHSGSKIKPNIDDAIKRNYQLYKNSANCDTYRDLIEKPVDYIFKYLAENKKDLYLTPDNWEKIYNDIAADKNSLIRYFPMTAVEAKSDLYHVIRSFVINDELWVHCGKG